MELVLRNRRLLESDLATIQGLIQTEGSQGRTHLSRCLCRLWEWRQPNGAFREIACRDLLHQLERRNLIALPAPLHAARRPGYKNRIQALNFLTEPITVSLDRMASALRIESVAAVAQRHLRRDLLGAYHNWSSLVLAEGELCASTRGAMALCSRPVLNFR